MNKGIKTYLLIDETKAPVWQLRHHNVFVDDPKLGQREIHYVTGSKTIFDDEQPNKDFKYKSIDFKDGKFIAQTRDKILITYIENHPEYKVKFRLLDPEYDARLELEREDQIFNAQTKLRELDDNEMAAVAATIFGDVKTRNWQEGEVRKNLNEYVKQAGEILKGGVSKTEYFLEVLKSPLTDAKFLVTQAIRKKVIKISTDRTSIGWHKSGGAIIPIAVGESPTSKLAEFLLTKEGDTTFQELGKRLQGPAKKKEKEEVGA